MQEKENNDLESFLKLESFLGQDISGIIGVKNCSRDFVRELERGLDCVGYDIHASNYDRDENTWYLRISKRPESFEGY